MDSLTGLFLVAVVPARVFLFFDCREVDIQRVFIKENEGDR